MELDTLIIYVNYPLSEGYLVLHSAKMFEMIAQSEAAPFDKPASTAPPFRLIIGGTYVQAMLFAKQRGFSVGVGNKAHWTNKPEGVMGCLPDELYILNPCDSKLREYAEMRLLRSKGKLEVVQ